MTDLSGIIIIDKPTGWTSFDVVSKIRSQLKVKKVGHAGTLDPMATGVLVILVGSATKQSDTLLSQDKVYQATISFGQQTDTGDADGLVTKTSDASRITEQAIQQALLLVAGTRQQQVPAYSAVKIKGKKLYELARAGKAPTNEQLPSRTITIHHISLDQFKSTSLFPTATITVTCSKGTYIRVLAEEIAQKLHTVAHLSALKRLASGQYTIDQAITLDQFILSDHPETYIQ